MKAFFKKISSIIKAHKIWTIIILIAIIGGGYYWYATVKADATVTQYTLKRATLGTIAKTVSGTGQVTAQNQRDVESQVSGTLKSIDVSIGQEVKTGDLIATIDPTDAANSLQSAKIAYAKLVEAPTQAELDSANDSVAQAYSSAYSSISNAFIDLQTVMPGLNTLLYGKGEFLSDQEASYLTTPAQAYRLEAGTSYDAANIQYTNTLIEYKALTRQSSTSTIAQVLDDTYALTKNVANTLQETQNTINYIVTYQSDYMAKDASSAQSEVTSWSNSTNSDVSSLLSAETSITSAVNSLNTLTTGATDLDMQAQQLSLDEAEQTYDKYFIRAPFDGIIGRIPANVGDSIGGSTVIATVVGENKMTTISLDEVDAAQVKAGDPVTMTFDAIDGLTATGTVSSVDLVGTVSSGVVSYNVKINIDTKDDRILAGMSINVVITTEERDNVIVVPSSAITTQGKNSFVKVVNYTPINRPVNASSTASSSTYRMMNASSTAFASSSRMTSARASAVTVTVTASTVTPQSTQVTLGLSDDTNMEILTGLSAGQWIVTKTTSVSSSNSSSNTSSSLLNMLGGNRTGNRTAGTTGAARTTTSSSGSSAARTTTSSSGSSGGNTGGAGGPPGGF
jgi:HlyD family secretion protein